MRPGEVVDGRWRPIRPLGRGAGGEVWLAADLHAAGREVALKLGLGGLDPVRLERFRREGAIAASLKHPGIVAVHTSGTWQDRPYLAFELVSGARDLRAAAAGLPLQERAGLVRDAARALAHAHERGVVHRDVKPENLLVDAAGGLRVTDFGLATSEGLSRLTATGAFVGTPSYTAPEQLTGAEEPGPPADVWSLGVVLYEALTGVLPFQAEGLVELAGRVTQARFTPPSELVPELDGQLEQVCRAALAPVPADRYPSARELADDLDAVLEGRRPRLVPALTRASRAPRALVAALLGVGLSAFAWSQAAGSRTPPVGPGPTPRAARPAEPAPVATAPGPARLGWRLARGDELAFELGHGREGNDVLTLRFRWLVADFSARQAMGKATIEAATMPRLKGQEPSLALDPESGEVLSVRGFPPKTRGVGGIQALVVESLASDPSIQNSLRLLLHVLPGKPVVPGDRWSLPIDLGDSGRGQRSCELVEGPAPGELTILSRLTGGSPGLRLRSFEGRTRWRDGRVVESIVRVDWDQTGEADLSWRIVE